MKSAFLHKVLDFIPGYQAWRSRTAPGGGGISHANIETLPENDINDQKKADSALADIRDFIRNSSFGQTILQQLQVNAVGTTGGRLSVGTTDDEFNRLANRSWARYAANCGFSSGASFNEILRDVVGCLFFNGGDALIVFDNGQITGGRGTGKVLMFESDQIANAPERYFKKNFPDNWRQERGMIFDQYGRVVGFFAGGTRGEEELPLNKDGTPKFITFLDKHPDLDPLKRPFCFVARTWRPNQGRGVSAVMHVINELRNLEDLGAAETAAAKLNSHLGLAIEEDQAASDALVVDALMKGQQAQVAPVKFDRMLRQQSAILQLPAGKKVTSFDTKRPNDRIPEYIAQLQGNIVATFGLGKDFMTLTPAASYTAARAALLMAWQSIRVIQRDLETVCNWLASQWFYWRRTAPTDALQVSDEILENIDFSVEWAWPGMPEIDNQKHQSTITQELGNTNLTLRKLHGPEWRAVIDERERERQYCLAHGEVYPGDKLVSGGTVTPNTVEETANNGE